jgi:hypothetical protein
MMGNLPALGALMNRIGDFAAMVRKVSSPRPAQRYRWFRVHRRKPTLLR